MGQTRGTEGAALDASVARIRRLPDAPPGVVLGVSTNGQQRWSASGVAQVFDDDGPLLRPEPVDLWTATDLGSVTKIVGTTTALMVLADRGQLDLGATLGDLVPRLAGTAAGGATVEQLLQHRAGLWEWWPTYLEESDPLTTIADLPRRHQPDAGRHYSDLGFMLLGAVVGELVGTSLEDAVSGLVLRPIGLPDTSYRSPAAGLTVAASSNGDLIEREMVRTGNPYPVGISEGGFPGWREQVLVGEVNDGNAFHSFDSVAGHSGLFSTAADLLTYGDALLACLRGEGIISSDTLRLFLKGGANPLQALGFRVWPVRGTMAWGHTGFPGVAVAVLPELGRTVALVTNRLHVAGAPISTEASWVGVLNAITEPGESP